ncbi:MAG: Eco57I restriction-modification methylase domain-containing protein [Candidatus Hodarchaeota archaeon]
MRKRARIMEQLEIWPTTSANFEILIAALRTIFQYGKNGDTDFLDTLGAPVLDNLNRLDSDQVRYVISEMSKERMPIEKCQILVQKQIPFETRKRYAVYYSLKDGIDHMISIVCEYLSRFRKKKIVLADPFLGSARTLTEAIRRIGYKKIEKVWGIEPLRLPALVGYASLLKAVKGKKDLVTVKIGDAFKEVPYGLSSRKKTQLPRSDIILTNPPFTRWRCLEEEYRRFLVETLSNLGYRDYITKGEANLQLLSMFLVDYCLKDNGLLASILPASTFYTIYGKGYKLFLKEKYAILKIVGCASRPSFSEDSGFKEVILSCIKGAVQNGLTLFGIIGKIGSQGKERKESILRASSSTNRFTPINIHRIPRFLDFNWSSLLEKSELRDLMVSIFKQGLKNGTMGYWSNVIGKKNIIRGVEMYGPDFFFIPNKYWRILREDEISAEIENVEDKSRLTLNKDFLVRALRKPSLYSDTIRANSNSYMVSIPPHDTDHLSKDLRIYIRWGKEFGTANPSIRAWGKFWYSHVYRQMASKKPYGRIFVPDKIDLSFAKRSVFANYTDERIAASKNFFIIRSDDDRMIKPLIGWFNSTIFISALVLLGRRISDRWTRFLENDYLELPVINIESTNGDFSKTTKSVNNMLNKRTPPLWNQLGEGYRYELDISLIKGIGVKQTERTVDELYKVLQSSGYGSLRSEKIEQ